MVPGVRAGLTCQWNSCTAPLGPEELELIHRQIEEGFEVIGAVDDEIRGIVARNWPHLLAKLPPPEDERCWRLMPRKPQAPSQPSTWTIYRAAAKAIRLGASKLIAVERR
jgi:hypothetical protein